MKSYLNILQKIVDEGVWKQNRTGIKTKSITGYMFEHNMKDGFPALTTKKLAFKTMAVELEGFIKGITDKRWYEERGCKIWSEWANPKIAPYGTDSESKNKMLHTRDLGPIYGFNWRKWGARYKPTPELPNGLEATVCGVAHMDYDFENLLHHQLKSTWYNMIQRCYDRNNPDYYRYGQISVHVSNDWLVFSNFVRDVQLIKNWNFKLIDWNEWTLDKDLKGGYIYSVENCIWLNKKQQSKYRRDVTPIEATNPNGEIFSFDTISECAITFDLDASEISRCLSGENKQSKGWTFKRLRPKKIEFQGIDQFAIMIDKLKKNPLDRRNIVTAWDPSRLHEMALPPCHYSFQVLSDGENVDLLWNQRSVDTPLGLSFNIASYALLLELIGKETGLIPNKLIGFLADVHIYENQYDTVLEQLKREPLPLPTLELPGFTNIFNWTHEQAKLIDYNHHGKLDYPVAV